MIVRILTEGQFEVGEDQLAVLNELDAAVAVRDHGVGMTPEQTREVFNRFWRGDPARARTVGRW